MRQPLFLRLRPFLRRDLRARLLTAMVAVFVLTGLTWLGISALTKIDSAQAHQLRVSIGLESANEVCGGYDQPTCEYDDRIQAEVDAKFYEEQKLRLAVLDELAQRVDLGLRGLDEAEALVRDAKTSPGGVLVGDTVAIQEALLAAIVDLRPAPAPSVSTRQGRIAWPLEALEHCDQGDFDGVGWVDCDEVVDRWRGDHVPGRTTNMREALLAQIELERAMLGELKVRVAGLLARDGASVDDFVRSKNPTEPRPELVDDLIERGDLSHDGLMAWELASWLAERPSNHSMLGIVDHNGDYVVAFDEVRHAAEQSELPGVHVALASLARNEREALHVAAFDPYAEVWHEGWITPPEMLGSLQKESERYRSPITGARRWQLIGTGLFLLATLMLIVVGPVVTATTTAREREAGTLPVLRMTGLSAMDLALAMAIGPNVFALVAGGGLLMTAALVISLTTGPGILLVPIALVLGLSAATHLTAIGLGDALGQRVNALVVGGLLAMGVLVPGAVGATMIMGDLAATGFLLGPLPATLAAGASLSELPFATSAFAGGASELGGTILVYGAAVQVLLGATCLLSWRRRVEQGWAPLFRPFEGAALALASVGCSALAVLDLSERVRVQTYDDVNLLTFLATGFLMPVLGWLLVSSLVRPARASSVTSVTEVRRAFWRFQAFVALTVGALAFAYNAILQQTGLASEQSEVMWATLLQALLLIETAVATLLWASRKREGRHRILILGATVALMQLGLAIGIYNLEVEHVAITQNAANPFLLGMDASPYWLAFLVVCWAAGLGLILAALLRERDRAEAAEDSDLSNGDDEEDKPHRWLH